MEVMLIKVAQGALVPADEAEADKLRRMKVGALVKVEATELRNPKFHRKFHALMRLGYDHFEAPAIEHLGQRVQKNYEQFREDITILAGFYSVYYRLDGSYRIRAKSIKFGRMKQETFEHLYSAVADVLLSKVLTQYQNRAVLDNVVNQIMGFV